MEDSDRKSRHQEEHLEGNDPAVAARGLKVETRKNLQSEQEGGPDLDPDITRDDTADIGSTAISRSSSQ